MNTFRPFFLFVFFLIFIQPTFSTILYVNQNIIGGTNDGLTWENAISNLQTALQQAERGDEIWVAQGTYFPTQNPFRKITFTLPEGVALFGGFNGTELNQSERNPALHETILSGDIGVVGDSLDNSHTVLYINVLENDSTRVVDGLTIQGGNANSEEVDDFYLGKEKSGGGLFIEGISSNAVATPKIYNCRFIHNYGQRGGGILLRGMSITDGTGDMDLQNCVFIENSALNGGGIHFRGSGKFKEIEIKNCSFFENKAQTNGGGVYYTNKSNSDYDLIISDCFFQRNYAAEGGAISFEDEEINPGLQILNCKFLNHQSQEDDVEDGTILYAIFKETFENNVSNIVIRNSNFHHNGSSNDRSLFNFVSIFPRFDDIQFQSCQFANNRAHSLFTFEGEALANFQNCLIADNVVNFGTIFEVSGSETPLFRNFNLINSTIVNNFRPGMNMNASSGTFNYSGTGFYNFNINIRNSIFLNNIKRPNGKLFDFIGNGTVTVENSLIDVADCSEITDEPTTCTNNFYNLAPHFVDTLTQNYRLQNCSPAINAGNNDFLIDLNLTTDLDSQLRIQDNIVDIGAYEVASIQLEIDSIIAVTCEAGTSGEVDFLIANSCEPHIFTWTKDLQSGTGTTGLTAGNYQFTITDANNRTATLAVEIPTDVIDLDLEIAANSVLCADGIGGQTAAIIMGGTAPFSYFWNNDSTDSLLQNLPQGTYQLTVTDQNGCTATAQTTIENEGLLGLGITTSLISCHDTADGSAAVSPIGGQVPYTYIWTAGETDSLLTNLSGGAYSVTVTDAFGCEDELDFSISPPDSLAVNLESMDALCFGENSGMATAISTGGTAPYNYQWSDFSTEETIENLAAGSYQLTIVDVQGCEQIADLIIDEPTEITGIFDIENIACFGENDGTIAAAAMGGTSPYQYIWNNNSNDSLLENLTIGNYDLIIQDGNGCTIFESFTLTQPDSLAVEFDVSHASSNIAADGAIDFSISTGGTAPFSYFWNTNETTPSLENLAAGNYQLTVTDANDCTYFYEFEVEIVVETLAVATDLIFDLYPNPTNDILTLDLPNNEISAFYIYNAVGQLVLKNQLTIPVNQLSIEVTDLPTSVYWLEIWQGKTQRGVRRFLKE